MESARQKSPSFSVDEFGTESTQYFLNAKIGDSEANSNTDLVLLVRDI